MQLIAITALILLMSFFTAELQAPANAENNKASDRSKSSEANLDGMDEAIDLKRFPGVGSIEKWKASVPEYRAGMAQMKKRHWNEAIDHFKASLALYEYQTNAWFEIGKATEAKNGLSSEAEKAYRNCLKLDTRNWKGWRGLSNVLYMQKRYDEAREAVTSGLELDPPPTGKEQMRKIVEMINSAEREADTQGRKTAQ